MRAFAINSSVLALLIVALFAFASSKDLPLTTKNEKKMRIDVYSDIVCPFCYIGKKKLEKAMTDLGLTDQIEVVWHSYQLDPDFQKGISVAAGEHLQKKKGISSAQLSNIYAHLKAQGENYGIDFQFEKCLTFNTFDAHRLLKWASEEGKADALKSAFFRAYFTDGLDLSQNETLAGLAVSVGLSKEKALEVLVSSQYEDAVYADINKANAMRISGVPHFVFTDKIEVSGAQSDQTFEKALQKMLKHTSH